MPPKNQQNQKPSNPQSEGSPSGQSGQNVVSDREVRQESAKAARQAQQAKKKAKELRDAAYGAGDPEERQKLLEQAIDKEIEAESFGKTAKYLRSGTFQGMVMGTGIGVVPGLTLGTLTGTLVGGLVSLITGGLGAGVGALTGWIHGPFWNMGEVAGKGIQKITGNLPGWVATDKQKRTLEKMLGQIKEEDMPDDDELDQLGADDGSDMVDEWGKKASSTVSSYTPQWMKSKEGGNANQGGKQGAQSQGNGKQSPAKSGNQAPRQFPATQKAGDDLRQHMDRQHAQSQRPAEKESPTTAQQRLGAEETGKENVPPSNAAQSSVNRSQHQPHDAAAEQHPETSGQTEPSSENSKPPQRKERKKPRKLETRSAPQQTESTSEQASGEARKPRKLERRS